MKIQHLEIRNIRGIKYIKVEPEGQNLVVFGPNGTGKSAIVDAIDFLLTGKISRLTGEGTKALSLKQHGCHVDSRDDLENTIVVAKVEVDGKEVVLERSISKPSSLEVKPKNCRALVEPYLETATLGLHILSRREILKYITAEAGKRAKEVMSLLNLMDIENLRAAFVTLKNEAKAEFKNAESGLKLGRSEVSKLLSLDSFSEKASLNRVNKLREALNGSKITKIAAEKIKENLKPYPFGAIEGVLTKDQMKNTADEIRSLIQVKDSIMHKESELKILLEEVQKDVKLKFRLLYEKLFEAGLSLIDDSDVCPLCGRRWEEGEFRSYLENRRKEMEIDKQKQERIDELSTFLKTELDLLKNDMIDCVKAHEQFNLKTIEDKRLKGYLTELEYWSEVMVNPITYYEEDKWPSLSCQEIFGAFLENNVLVPLEDALEKVGEQFSKQQIAWDTLTKLEVQWKRYQQALEARELSNIYKRRAEASLGYFEKARDSVLENIYNTVKESFDEFYKTLHSEDESKFVSEISHVGAELNFEVDFYQRGMFPPHALHSEGHQDSMGLCLFFALNNYLIKDSIKVIILDDVVMSIDRSHRRAVCHLLKEIFPDKQYIITTHDNAWAKQLRTEGIVTQKNMIHFTNWNIDTGPIFELEKDLWDKIKEDLDRDDVPSAAHKLRRNAECFFENLCDFLGARILYKGHHQWELGDYAPAAISIYKRYLKKAKSNFQKMKQEDKFKEIIEIEKRANRVIADSQIEQWVINENVHYNRWEGFSKQDFEPVVKAFQELFSLFTCSSCGTMISVSEGTQATLVSCGCGKIFWNIHNG